MGGQVQVVTKSGSRNFSGSAYWYARRSEWNENTWFEQAHEHADGDRAPRDDRGFTLGGPIFIPGVFNTERNKLFFFFNQEFQRRKDPVGETRVTVPTALERQGNFSQSVDAQREPLSLHQGLHAEPALQRHGHLRVLQGRRRARQDPGEPPVQPDAGRAEPLPDAEHAGRGLQLPEPDAVQEPARPDDDPVGLPDQQQLARDRPVHVRTRTRPSCRTASAGGRSGATSTRSRSSPTSRRATRMISTTGILNNTTSLEISARQRPTTRSITTRRATSMTQGGLGHGRRSRCSTRTRSRWT